MANYRRIVAFNMLNMCLHVLVLCSIYYQCTNTFSLLFHATTTCPIQMPACYVQTSTRSIYPRGIWKILRMLFYLSDLFLNPIMFGIILKSYISSMLWHKYHEDIIMQTQKILL